MRLKITLLLLSWLVASYPVLAKTLCVSQDTPLNQSGCAQVFTVIQDAIIAAEDGDTVKIFPGLWPQNIFVTKPIVVVGTNFPNTIIHPPSGPAVMIFSNGFVSCLSIKSETNHGVIITKGAIKNCIIEGCSNLDDFLCSGVRYMNDSTVVTNCLIQRSGYHGIFGQDKNGTVKLINNVLANNRSFAGYSYDEATAELDFNCYWQNMVDGWGWIGGISHGDSDMVADPRLDANYLPLPDSPLLNKGDTAIFNPDGSRSDIGVYGGPDSCTCSVLVGVEDSQTPELKITIMPNPATDLAVINYQLPSDCPVTVTISDCLGQIVATPLQNQWQATGKRQINFALNGLPSGAYLCTIKTSFTTATNKFAVIR